MDDYELATALFKQPKDTKSARIVSGTAYGDSSDGTVQVDLDGSVVSLQTNVPVKEGDTVQVTLSDRSPVVTGVVGWGDQIETDVGDARKVATNYIDYNDTDGVVVGNMTEGVLGANTQICVEDDGGVDKATINLRDGSTVLAKFQDDEIDLGVNSTSSVIDLCNGSARLFQTGGFFVIDAGANVIDMKLANSTTTGGHAYWGNVGTTLGTTPNAYVYMEAGRDNSTGKIEAFDRQASGGMFGVRITGPIHLASYNDPGTAGQVLTSQGAGQTPTWGSLATVATSGNYTDLMNKPTLPKCDLIYDTPLYWWDSGAISGTDSGADDPSRAGMGYGELTDPITDYDFLVLTFRWGANTSLTNGRLSQTVPVANIEQWASTADIEVGTNSYEFMYLFPAANPSYYIDVAYGFTDATHLYAKRRAYSNLRYWNIDKIYGVKL